MPDEELTIHPWPRPAPLAGAPVWCAVLGQLTGYGNSSRTSVSAGFHPHLVTRGHGTFDSARRVVEVGPGDLFCLWPGVAHSFREDPDDPWRFYWMRLEGEGAEDMARDMGYAPADRVHRPGDPERAIRCFRDLFRCYSQRENRDPYEALSLLYELVAACRGPGPAASRRSPRAHLVEEAKALVESLLDTGINVSGLAERLNVSRQALLAAFRQEAGVTPVDYIQTMRVGRAKQLLERTDLKVSAVAHSCGYGHEKYFYRRFRELAGCTPGEWRSRHAVDV